MTVFTTVFVKLAIYTACLQAVSQENHTNNFSKIIFHDISGKYICDFKILTLDLLPFLAAHDEYAC